MNGSPLFTGDAGSGESQISRFILEQDLLEALNIVFALEGAVAVACERELGMVASHRFPTFREAKSSGKIDVREEVA